MTLQAAGDISMSQVNTELQQSSSSTLSLGDAAFRALSKIPSGTIRLSDMYGKTYYTQASIAAWMDANLLNVFRWCIGGDDTYDANVNGGPYVRYVESSTYTGNFSLSGASIVGTSKFDVIVGITGCSPSFADVTIAGSGVSITSVSDHNNNTEQVTRVLHCSGDFRNLTSVSCTWNHVAANRGSWCGMMVVPGNWSVVAAGNQGAYTLPANTLSFMTAYSGGADGPVYWITDAGGMRYKQTDAWWYNNGGTGAFVNVGSAARTGSMGNINVNLLLLSTLDSVQ